MLKGFNAIGFEESKEGNKYLHAFSPVKQKDLPENFTVATTDEVNKAVAKAVAAFGIYKSLPPETKAVFLETIAE